MVKSCVYALMKRIFGKSFHSSILKVTGLSHGVHVKMMNGLRFFRL